MGQVLELVLKVLKKEIIIEKYKNMSSYLVTGGAGFIGSHLVNHLIAQGHYVTILDSCNLDKTKSINPKAKFISGSITDLDILNSAFNNIDTCYHLAAVPSIQKSIDEWYISNQVNLGGTIAIFDLASKKNIPVIYASSAAAYGVPTSTYVKESDICSPMSPYGFDKYSTEIQARLFAEIKGLKSVGLRFFNVYGPGQDPKSPYSGVISIFIDKMLAGKPLQVFGDGSQERDFIYVDDIVNGLIKAQNQEALNKSSIFNLCSGKGTSLNELIDILSNTLNIQTNIEYLPSRPGDIYKSIGDPTKARNIIEFSADISIKDGLKKLYSSLI